jgi:dipeptidyl aminopeptidase/acylaminoacyl peptidase
MGSRLMHALALSLPAIVLVASLPAQPRQGVANPVAGSSRSFVPGVLLSPDQSKLLLMERTTAASDREVARTYSALVVQPIGRGETRRLILPWKARVKSVFWAPDGHRVAFTILEEQGSSLWVGDAYTGVIRLLAGSVFSSRGEPCQWFQSGESLLCSRTPADLQPVSGAEESHDRDLQSQLVVFSLSGPERLIGQPAIHGRVAISPDGNYLTVETIHRSSSDQLPLERLPVRVEVWDAHNGTVLRVVHDRGSIESPPQSADAVVPGPRSVEWRGDKPATLVWVEAQDGGNPAAVTKIRDRMFQLASPFTGSPTPFADLEFRSRGVVWGDGDLAVISEGWSSPGWSRSWIVTPNRGGTPRLLLQGGRDATPGNFLTRPKRGGGKVLLTSRAGRLAYLLGAAYLDQIDLATGRTQRLWRSQAPFREEVVGVIDAAEGKFITRRESAGQPPNYFIRNLKKKGITQLTNFK